MSSDAAALLSLIRKLGARATTVDGAVRIYSPVALPVALQEGVRLHRAEILILLEAEATERATAPTQVAGTLLDENYRRILRRLLALLAAGPHAPVEECERFMQEEVRLAGELGQERARQIRRAEGQAWWQDTGRCPHCGEVGDLHAPSSGAPEARPLLTACEPSPRQPSKSEPCPTFLARKCCGGERSTAIPQAPSGHWNC